MLNLIVGNKGSGKTKRLIEMIDNSLKVSKGDIVCIEKGLNMTYNISHKVRLVSMDDYEVACVDGMYGFVSGLLAGNHDTSDIYIDGVLKIIGNDLEGLTSLIKKLDKLSVDNDDVKIIITVSADEKDLSSSLSRYFI